VNRLVEDQVLERLGRVPIKPKPENENENEDGEK